MRRSSGSASVLPIATLVVLIGAAETAPAVEFRGGQNVVIGADEVISDDLYVAAQTVVVEGTIEGDLVSWGRQTTLNGRVTGDLIACGQAVVVNGQVGDDVRMAAMVLQLGPTASIGDDVVSAGLSFESEPGSTIGGTLLFGGFQALVAGDVDGGLLGSMTALEIRGRIAGYSDVDVEGDAGMPAFMQFIPTPVPFPAVPGGLTIGEDARIEDVFDYTSTAEAKGPGSTSARLSRVEPEAITTQAGEMSRKTPWTQRFFRWLGLLMLGLLLVWSIPGWLERRSTEIAARPVPLAGLGLVGAVALPVSVLLIVFVIGFFAVILGLIELGNLAALAVVMGLVAVGLLGLLFWLTSSYLAPILVGIWTGRSVLSRSASETARGLGSSLLVGLALLGLLRLVPFLGFVVGLVVLLLGWGAVLAWLWGRLRTERSPT